MIEIKKIAEIKKGDIVIINGFTENCCIIATVSEVDYEHGELLFNELDGIDYSADDLNQIIVIGNTQTCNRINIVSQYIRKILLPVKGMG
ncbi:MAG: hypothetical protein QM504_11060 [Pseudomonadota bacterium]